MVTPQGSDLRWSRTRVGSPRSVVPAILIDLFLLSVAIRVPSSSSRMSLMYGSYMSSGIFSVRWKSLMGTRVVVREIRKSYVLEVVCLTQLVIIYLLEGMMQPELELKGSLPFRFSLTHCSPSYSATDPPSYLSFS